MPDASSLSSPSPDPASGASPTDAAAHHVVAGATPDATSDDRLAVVADLVLAVLEAGRVTRGLGEAVNKLTGIRRADYLTLLRIQESDACRISDIAAGLELDVSVISRKIASLDELGLVSRSPHPDDGRAQVVSVTDLGRETIGHNRRLYTEAIARMTAQWDTAELETLAAGLHRLGTHQPESAVAAADAAEPGTTDTTTSTSRSTE
ncbi:MarR family winged helix-turn-helix transcriptional regulator [Georgenia sp. Z1344]|uniref:MarR family winged helix-turn-helix transcriptional regulator n=1 Tax=Georgenia sp. Z1344 TaxID=3416706 RepID=UPI003CF32CFA